VRSPQSTVLLPIIPALPTELKKLLRSPTIPLSRRFQRAAFAVATLWVPDRLIGRGPEKVGVGSVVVWYVDLFESGVCLHGLDPLLLDISVCGFPHVIVLHYILVGLPRKKVLSYVIEIFSIFLQCLFK
jgi:hypothetical protein